MNEKLLNTTQNADSTDERLDALADVVEKQTKQIKYLETAIKAIGQETGIGICGECSKCSNGVMLSQDGALKCSSCGTVCYLG